MEKQGNKVLGIIGIVCGAFAIVFAYWYMANIAAVIAGVAGIVLAVLAKKSFKEAGQTSPIPTIALVLSIVGTVLAVIGLFTCTICVCAANQALNDPSVASALEDNLNNALNDALSSLS